MTASLHRAVLATRAVPGLRSLYQAAYAAAAGASARALGGVRGVESVILHRGATAEGWEPGVSDIDLILRTAEFDDPRREAELLGRLGRRAGLLKAAFPMLGDLWIGSSGELTAYLRWGGLRAWDDSPRWKTLSGPALERPALTESPEKRRRLDPWTWALVSHMELSRRLFCAAGLSEKNEADLRKLFLDAVRFSQFAADPEDGARLRSRGETGRDRPDALERAPLELWLESSRLLAQAAREVLGRLRSGWVSFAAVPSAEAGDAVLPWMREMARAPGVRGVVCDLPYHAYLLVAEDADEADYRRAAAALSAAPAPGVPLVLTPSAWMLALQSAYLGAPLGWLGAGASGRSVVLPEGPCAGWGARAWGQLPEAVFPIKEGLAWETAAEAASWMLLWWRALWIGPAWPDRFVLYHLYTRALGLKLRLHGAESGPFGDWAGLMTRARERFPDEGACPWSLPDDCRRTPEHFGRVSGLMRALRAALAA